MISLNNPMSKSEILGEATSRLPSSCLSSRSVLSSWGLLFLIRDNTETEIKSQKLQKGGYILHLQFFLSLYYYVIRIKVFCTLRFLKNVSVLISKDTPYLEHSLSSNITWNTHFDIKLTFVCFLALANSSFCVKGDRNGLFVIFTQFLTSHTPSTCPFPMLEATK